MENVDLQQTNSKLARGEHLKAYQWKKGQSGNIMGRPAGKSMKEYARQYLERMTDEERDEWMEGLDKELIWKMSEGNARQDTDVTSGGEKLTIQFAPTFNGDE